VSKPKVYQTTYYYILTVCPVVNCCMPKPTAQKHVQHSGVSHTAYHITLIRTNKLMFLFCKLL